MEKSNKKQLYGVVCSVASCYYNTKNGHCTAKQIEVGPSSACTSAETVCVTFKERK